jgi:hypothetical protein
MSEARFESQAVYSRRLHDSKNTGGGAGAT